MFISVSIIVHQSIPVVPTPPPPGATAGHFAQVVSPGDGALANFMAAQGAVH